MDNKGNATTNDAIHSLACAALETFLHQILFVCNVYPADSFTKSSFLGIVGQVNRHPGVVEYISQCVRVAVPVLLKNGGQMIVLLGKTEELNLKLRINLHCHNHQQEQEQELYQHSTALTTKQSVPSLYLLESRFRDLILSVHAMKQQKEKHDSFQIQLCPEEADCEELIDGMSDGRWYQVNQSSRNDQESMIRPIYDVHCDDCEIMFYCKKSI